MAESEVNIMGELKKAYAEMILNTAKAAAERVVDWENKALGFHHDLVATKEESLRLLLRLKHIIDAKESEILRTTSSQKSKIDVLEAQLQEAESVIIDLRAELSGARHKLEKVKQNHDQPLSDNIMKEDVLSHQNALLEPIMLVPSKPQLQIVMSNGGLDHSSTTGDVLTSKETNICDSERMENFSSNIAEESNRNLSSFMIKNAERIKNFSSQEVKDHVNIQSLGEKKTPFGILKTKWGSYPVQLTKPYQVPAILSRRKLYLGNGNAKSPECSHALSSIETHSFDTKKNSRELKDLSKNDRSESDWIIVEEAKRQKKEQCMDAASSSFIFNPDQLSKVCQPSFYPTRCNSYSSLLHGNGNLSEDCSKVHEKINLRPLPHLDSGLTLVRGGDSTCNSTNVKMLNGSCILQNAAERNGEHRKAERGAATQDSADQLDDSDMEMAATPVEYSDSRFNGKSKETTANGLAECSESQGAESHKECNIFSPRQAENNRPIKYTFHRRHKKQALSRIDENISWDNNNVNMALGERQNFLPEIQKKSSLINDSNKSKRRLDQVAHQLISLTEERKMC